MNKVQIAAYELIQSDARFLYSLTEIQNNARNISSNYIMMCLPYIGIFTDGAEQWSRKMGLNVPSLNKNEKLYYTALRQSHKLLNKSYDEYSKLILEKYIESDNYFYGIRSLREKIVGYYNVGADICNGEYCGNTIICALNNPMAIWGKTSVGVHIRNMSVIAGKLAAAFGCTEFPAYRYDDNNVVKYKDYHFFKNCPLKMKTNLGLVLFSVLCNINYTIIFIDTYFVEDIPQKLKFAYLQYYYLCDFVKSLNDTNPNKFYINDSLKNTDFRNCLAAAPV